MAKVGYSKGVCDTWITARSGIMIAIVNQGGAFLYNCNFSEGQKRVKASLEIQRKHQYGDYSRQCLGSLDYDENGKMRKEDGMCGWLFSTKDLIS